jgi:hypothetical protein
MNKFNKGIEGGCFCGSVRYNFEPNDYPSANCHCSMCRRISAAPFVSWMAIPVPCFEYTQGEPKKLTSSSHGTRYFCQECGSPLVCILEEDPENIYITICSLDKPQDFKPKGDIYIDDKLPWVKKDS